MKFKRISVVICMLACLFAFAGCSAVSAETQSELPYTQEQIQQMTEGLLTQFATASNADLVELVALKPQNLTENGDLAYGHAIQAAAQSFLDGQSDLGAFQGVVENSFTMAVNTEGVVCTVDGAFANREATFTVIYDDELTMYTTAKVEPHYTLGENMSTAGLNTLMGMGTVFIVLIFIAFIISLFKYINQWEKGLAQKKKDKEDAARAAKAAERAAKAPAPAPAPAPVAPVVEVPVEAPAVAPAEPQVDDLELVAVITAAAASMMNTSVDQLFVRSIRKSRTNRRFK